MNDASILIITTPDHSLVILNVCITFFMCPHDEVFLLAN